MKVKFSHEFQDHNGREVKSGEIKVSLKHISVDCLMYPTDKDMPTLSGPEKVKRHDLGVKILNNGDNTELVAEEVSLLKSLIGARYIPCVVAQSYALLDGKELPVYNKE